MKKLLFIELNQTEGGTSVTPKPKSVIITQPIPTQPVVVVDTTPPKFTFSPRAFLVT